MNPRALTFFCIATTFVGCGACSIFDTNVESHVDVPVTLDALEEWASERDLSAEIGLIERGETGNIACGHSAACFILVPFIVADAILPPMLKHGSVTDGEGVVLYTGVFDLRGRLLRARVRADDEDVYREIARLDLPELGEHPIVERARVRVDAEGHELERTETSLLDQVDLVAMYTEALGEESDGGDRADLVVEELSQLGAPGLAAVEARYDGLDAIEDEELIGVLHEVCYDHAPGAELIVRVVAEKGGLAPAIKAVLCIEQGHLDGSHFTGIADRIVGAACEGDEVAMALPAAIDLAAELPDAVADSAAACESDPRRLHLLFHAGQRPSDEELERVLREDDESPLLVEAMRPGDENDRHVLVAAMDAPPARVAIARALNRSTTGPPTVEEMQRAVTVFAAEHEGAGVADMRHHLLAWMGRSESVMGNPVLAPLRAGGDEAHNAAALVFLGRERGPFTRALTDLDVDRIHWSSFDSPRDSFNDHTLVAYALVESGCTQEEIRAAARAVRQSRTPGACVGW